MLEGFGVGVDVGVSEVDTNRASWFAAPDPRSINRTSCRASPHEYCINYVDLVILMKAIR
jgi:hypothetical protein